MGVAKCHWCIEGENEKHTSRISLGEGLESLWAAPLETYCSQPEDTQSWRWDTGPHCKPGKSIQRMEFQSRQVSYAKNRDLVKKEWGPETFYWAT